MKLGFGEDSDDRACVILGGAEKSRVAVDCKKLRCFAAAQHDSRVFLFVKQAVRS